MDAQLATSKFQQAEKLFQEKSYADALLILDELDNAYPNTRNILQPKAKCLVNLGRANEAEAICDNLLAQKPDPVTQSIKDVIVSSRGSDAMSGMGIPGLALNDLDDILGASPRRKEPRVPLQAKSEMPRNILIALGAIVVVALVAWGGVMGAKKGWFTPVTAESVLTKVADIWTQTDSYSADMLIDLSKAPGPVAVSAKGNGHIEVLRQAGKIQSRMEGNMALSMEGTSMGDMTMIVVSDGIDSFTEMHMMGQVIVMKVKTPVGDQEKYNLAKVIEQLKQTYDLKLVKSEPLESAKAYVVQFTPRAGQSAKLPIPGMPIEAATIKGYFVQDDLTQCKILALDASGGEIGSIGLKNVNRSPGLSADRFKYTPPEGAKVMDMSEMQKLMPMMGGG